MDMSYVPAIGFVALWGLTALAMLIFAWIVYRVGRALSDSQVTGGDKTDTLLGLAAACAVCWPIFPWAGRTLSALALYLTRGLPLELTPAFQSSFEVCGGKKAPECTQAVILAYSRSWSETTSNLIIQLTNEVPYGWLIGFTMLWIIAGQLLGAIRETDPEQRPPLFRWVATTSRVQKLNGILLFTLFIAVYLSLASIAAVPTLTEDTEVPDTSSFESFEKQFPARLAAATPTTPENPFQEVEETIQAERAAIQKEKVAVQQAAVAAQAAEATNAPAPLPEPPPADPSPPVVSDSDREAILNEVQQAVNRIKELRGEAVRNVAEMEAVISRGIDNRRSDALSIYLLNLKRIGSRERDVHFLQLLTWYRSSNELAASALTTCVSHAKQADDSAKIWSHDVAGLLQQRNATGWTKAALDGEGAQRTRQYYYEAVPPCRAVTPAAPAPDRPRLGTGLGPFRLVAQWLLETESLSLALIVGMMGFGLLGSAVSTFVRETQGQQREDGAPLVADLGGVILRGVSAAIVVFLGVKGGLTVFAGNGSEPNPYVLLLTCLVGAVFSERVWDWAREKIIADGEKKKEVEAAPPPPPPAGPPPPAASAMPEPVTG